MDREAKIEELRKLREQVSQLEGDLDDSPSLEAGVPGQEPVIHGGRAAWAPQTYYTTYHILAGMVLGFIGAATSLLFNIVGAAMVGEHPLQLIRVYLTFPLGEKALSLDSGFALAAGCCLYLGTGMFGGIPFHLILSRYFDDSTTSKRFFVATALGIGVWLINYYGIIIWLQPMLIGGNWIVEEIPMIVAIMTHLVFAWTLLLVEQWGRFTAPAIQNAEARS